MNEKLQLFVLVVAIYVLSICGTVLSQDSKNTGFDDNAKISTEYLLQIDKKNIFTGKVVDLDGSPIEGVDIEVALLQTTSNPNMLFTKSIDMFFKTNKDGIFSFFADGRKIIVKKIYKKDYQVTGEFLNNSVFNVAGLTKDDIKLFQLRKKTKTACLVKKKCDLMFQKDNQYYYFDVSSIKIYNNSLYKSYVYEIKSADIFHLDFTVSSSIIDRNNEKGYRIKFSSSLGGFVVLKERVYEVPQTEFENEIFIDVLNYQKRKFYLIYKREDGLTASIIEIDAVSRYNSYEKKHSIIFDMDVWTNLFGNGVLDDNESIDMSERKRLLDDAYKKLYEKFDAKKIKNDNVVE